MFLYVCVRVFELNRVSTTFTSISGVFVCVLFFHFGKPIKVDLSLFVNANQIEESMENHRSKRFREFLIIHIVDSTRYNASLICIKNFDHILFLSTWQDVVVLYDYRNIISNRKIYTYTYTHNHSPTQIESLNIHEIENEGRIISVSITLNNSSNRNGEACQFKMEILQVSIIIAKLCDFSFRFPNCVATKSSRNIIPS